MTNKKAAMFALDARIALIIFGALSIITGATLYSTIKRTKLIAIITEKNEIEKALESYLINVGADLPNGTSSVLKDITELKESSKKGWQ